jgi:hypothetical protein
MKSTKQSQENPISRALTLMRQCPVCTTAYNKEMFRQIDQNDGAHLLHCTCQQCHQSVLALVMTSSVGVSSVGMVTDLTADDVTKISRKQSISEDELLSFHSLLTRQHVFEQSVLAAYQQ